ncbi:sugar ABC transporter substrate-binding protein [Arthrobacter sp. TS-15]|uniref:ABC transporter substrate-binding protein n=1 Tax=unclassified Arthrobacter TaxID=235627 RepID=UPI00115D1F34|nr:MULTISPECIES: sugar ABC transporter substrate-binding protein [unclassified Arthrobacter]TQS91362.1 sugar ABC transporter substrate-binding protein [Arthrobacter sp. TS-15]BCW63013.1 sugar ABC transporter substrate-binding protein [Arthrobacter sp. StoSoilB22]
MRFTRVSTLGAAALAGALALTGCGSSNTVTATASSAPAEATGDITFWSALPNMDKVAQAFNNSQDKIKVKFETVPTGANGGYAKLAAAIGAGTAPDVATVEYYALPQFASSDQLQPLDGVVAKETLEKYNDSSKSLVQLGGKTWALPYDAPPMLMWYREDLLAGAGSSVPQTWKEFEAAGKAVQAKYPGTYLASFNPNEPTWFAGLAWQNDARWFSAQDTTWNVGVNDAASKEVADLWQRMINDKTVKVVNSYSDEWTADIATGKAAGIAGASWSATSIQARAKGQEKKWIAAKLPQWNTPATSLYGGSTFAVPKTSKNPAAAAKFAEFLTTDPRAIAARGNTGSAYLADPELTATAKKAFDASFFANDIWSVFDEAAGTVRKDWQWGPNFDVTNSAAKDAFGTLSAGGNLATSLDSIQDKTITGLKQSGLSVK